MKKILTLFSAGVLMSTLCAGFVACNDEPERKMDTASFLKTLQSAPAELTTRDSLPEWLNDKIDFHTEEPSALMKVQVFKGELHGRVVYYIYDILSSCINCDFYDEMGEKLTDGQYDGEEWVLVWEFVGEIYTRSEFVDGRQVAEDEFIFPQLSDEWGLGETVQSSLGASFLTCASITRGKGTMLHRPSADRR